MLIAKLSAYNCLLSTKLTFLLVEDHKGINAQRKEKKAKDEVCSSLVENEQQDGEELGSGISDETGKAVSYVISEMK